MRSAGTRRKTARRADRETDVRTHGLVHGSGHALLGNQRRVLENIKEIVMEEGRRQYPKGPHLRLRLASDM
jgi:hypothetical protein